MKVGPSPDWLRAKIESVGIRSINNIVDISNFVMLELGQPTHAFDADKLKGGINVRLARDGEKFLALDGKTYSLTPENLVIADDERAVGIGGVMGGEETGVTESTRNVLLEAAYFLPASIRRTARNLNLPSDASYRFERGVDPGMILRASQRATELIREIANGNPGKRNCYRRRIAGESAGRFADLHEVRASARRSDQSESGRSNPGTVRLEQKGQRRKDRKNRHGRFRVIGAICSAMSILSKKSCAHGVEKIAGSDRSRFTPSSAADRSHDLESSLRERLVGYGLSEARTSKLIPRSATAATTAIELRNPLDSEDHVALRPSLIPGLLGVLERNVRAGAERVAIFEIGRVFVPPDGKEERRLGILLWGNAASAAHWRSGEKRRLDIVDLKGALESIAALSFRRSQHVDLALAMEILSGDQAIGFAGQLSAHAHRSMRPGAVLVAELNVDLVLAAIERAVFREMERFPAVTRDIAMIVPEKISHEEILRAIENPKEPLLESVELFDLFSGGEIGAARKSLAYRLTYRDRSRTLTSEEVTAAHAKIRERLQSELGAELRE